MFLFGGIVGLLIGKNVREEKVAIYRQVYYRAKKNDDIRYDEKIRFMERKRLEQEYDNDKNEENLKKTIDGPDPLQ